MFRSSLRLLPPRLRVRHYTKQDFAACRQVYDSNRGITLPVDESHIERHLQDPRCEYLVVEGADGILACGGFDQPAPDRACLAFGMVDRRYHGRGIGTLLLLLRLVLIDCSAGEVVVILQTSHKTEGFYRKFGFTAFTGYEATFEISLQNLWLMLQLDSRTQESALRRLQKYRDKIAIEAAVLERPN